MNYSIGTKDGYNIWSSFYDTEKNFLIEMDKKQEKFYHSILEDIKIDTNRALDIGCGTGRHLPLIEKYFNEVIGLDLSEGMLEKAKNKITSKNTKLICSDLDSSVLSGKFDYIHTSLAIMHFDDLNSLFSKMKNILSPRGKICIVDADESLLKLGTSPNFEFQGSDHIISYSVNSKSKILEALHNNHLNPIIQQQVYVDKEIINMHPKYKRYYGQTCLFYIIAENSEIL